MAYQKEIKVFENYELPLAPEPVIAQLVASPTGGITIGDATSPVVLEPEGLLVNNRAYIRSGQTDYNTGLGWWIGTKNGVGKFSFGTPTGNYITWDGTTVNIAGSYIAYGAGSIVLVASDVEIATANNAPTKLRETNIGQGSGTLSITFDLCTDSAAFAANAQVYRNGVAVGTLRTTISLRPTAVTYSEDIAGWSAGDAIQIYAYSAGGGKQAFITNFRIKANKSLIPFSVI